MDNSVEKLWNDITSIQKILEEKQDVSLLNDYNNTMRKVLLLSCGSFFEKDMTDMLKRYVDLVTNGNIKLKTFLEKQAIQQKYHTLFDWGKQNDPTEHYGEKSINKFSNLFGEDFKKLVNDKIEEDNSFKESKKYFIEIGHIRNIIVHNDFASYSYEHKTPEDIYELYKKAKNFIPKIEELLKL